MADEAAGTASADTVAPPSSGQAPVAQATSTPSPSDAGTPPEAQATDQATTTTPPPIQGEGEKKVDLFKSSEFRNWQATQTRQIQAAQERTAQLEGQLREQHVSGLNDYEKAQFAAQEATNRANGLERRLQITELQASKMADMQRLNDKTGVPMERLEKAESYEQATEMAMDWLAEGINGTVEAKVAEALTSRETNRPDTGGGQPQPVVPEREMRLQTAQSNNDAVSYVAAILSPQE